MYFLTQKALKIQKQNILLILLISNAVNKFCNSLYRHRTQSIKTQTITIYSCMNGTLTHTAQSLCCQHTFSTGLLGAVAIRELAHSILLVWVFCERFAYKFIQSGAELKKVNICSYNTKRKCSNVKCTSKNLHFIWNSLRKLANHFLGCEYAPALLCLQPCSHSGRIYRNFGLVFSGDLVMPNVVFTVLLGGGFDIRKKKPGLYHNNYGTCIQRHSVDCRTRYYKLVRAERSSTGRPQEFFHTIQ